MSFTHDFERSNTLINLIGKHYWEKNHVKSDCGLIQEPYGCETHISESTREALRGIHDPTARHIRFAPDCIIIQKKEEKRRVILLEYKLCASFYENEFNIGKIKAVAWENYMDLVKTGKKVAICINCPYYKRPLLCDFADESWLVQERTKIPGYPAFVGIGLDKLRTFQEFMQEIFCVSEDETKGYISSFLHEAKENPNLQINDGKNQPECKINRLEHAA
jgi:hypothetical protein